MNFSPKIGVIFSAFAVIISVIAFLSPTAFPSYVPIAVATAIISTCAFLNIILNAVNGVLHLYSSSAPGPLAPKDSPLVTAATTLQAQQTNEFQKALDPAIKSATTTIIAAAAKTASALLVGALFIGVLVFGGSSMARAAENARPVATGPVIDPLGLSGKATSASPLTADLSKAVSDVFKTIVDYFSTGLDEAESLSIAVPSIQDGNGHDCAIAGKSLMAELKVHPEVISGHAAADIEGLRVTVSALHQICASNACRQVFSEADNAIATLGIGVSIPAFAALCSKLPSVELVKPELSDPTPAATPTPTATGN